MSDDRRSESHTRHRWSMDLWAVVAAFGAYFCMYAFRKPFTAATYDLPVHGAVDFKSWLVVAQTLGYMTAKFVGIKVISELPPHRRAGMLVALIAGAELALLGFGMVPAPFNAAMLFVNGLMLGMIFGLVLGFLEGRQRTEALTAGLCVSFIVADGVVQSVGAFLLTMSVPSFWMPFVAGLIFFPPLLVFVWMLQRIPAPTDRDVATRSERSPMTSRDRRGLFARYALGLSLLTAAYFLVTILRSVRNDFRPEIWRGLDYKTGDADYAWSEILVGLGILPLFAAASTIRDNRRGFFYGLTMALLGAVLLLGTLFAQRAGSLAPFPFMVLLGLGLYLPYIAVHTTIFERFIAVTRDRGTVAFLMYLVDAYGYLGYVLVLVVRKFVGVKGDFLGFFLTTSWVIAVGVFVLLALSWRYFAGHPAIRAATSPTPVANDASARWGTA